ncbi:MAG: beta-lactamase family protein [Lentisphaeria bacterium]|nr:beta-lactamase family protein [Lentisphaeria bacterium]
MSDLVKELQAVLDAAVENGEECGCQLAVFKHGELICSLSSGYTDADCTRRIDEETLFPVFSVGKGVVTTLLHHLVEQGKLSYDGKVSDLWPEFGCNGKEDTRIWHVMSHRAGLFEPPKSLDFLEWFNWPTITAALAAAAPAEKIGGMHHYHAHTYGALAGHIAELADGRELRRLLKEELFAPLGINGIFFGISDEQYGNLAPIVKGNAQADDSRLAFNQHEVLSGLNPSSNGCANALSLARFYSALLPEAVGGDGYLKSETIARATTICRCQGDDDLTNWDRFGLGYALCGPKGDFGRMFGHGGACGSEGFCDLQTGYAVGFTKNQLNLTHPVHPTRNEISRVLGLPPRVW